MVMWGESCDLFELGTNVKVKHFYRIGKYESLKMKLKIRER